MAASHSGLQARKHLRLARHLGEEKGEIRSRSGSMICWALQFPLQLLLLLLWERWIRKLHLCYYFFLRMNIGKKWRSYSTPRIIHYFLGDFKPVIVDNDNSAPYRALNTTSTIYYLDSRAFLRSSWQWRKCLKVDSTWNCHCHSCLRIFYNHFPWGKLQWSFCRLHRSSSLLSSIGGKNECEESLLNTRPG